MGFALMTKDFLSCFKAVSCSSYTKKKMNMNVEVNW